MVDPLSGGIPWAIGVEFSLTPDPDMLSRQMIYLGEARLSLRPSEHPGDRFHVAGVVVNLTGEGKCAQDMHWPKTGMRFLIQPREINLASMQASGAIGEIEAGLAPLPLLALIPLMQGGGDDAIIQCWLPLAQRETNPRRRAELGLALVFAEAAKCAEVWQDALEGWSMIESKVVNEWTRQAVERATLRTMADAVIELLQDRLGTPPADLVDSIRAVNELPRLKRLLLVAGRVATFEQFRTDANL